MTHSIFEGTGSMMLIVVMACLVVLVAMSIDLASGLYKAKLRGEFRSSQALKRSLNKFITYEGGMLIAAGVDVLMHFSNIVNLFGWDAIFGVPVVTCLVGVFLLTVEFISIREKADHKTKKQMDDAAIMIANMLQNDNFKEVVRLAIEQQDKRMKEEEE